MFQYQKLGQSTRLAILLMMLTAFVLLLLFDNSGFFIGLLGGLLISVITAEIILYFKNS